MTVPQQPAWSAAFDEDVLESLEAIPPIEAITPEWAFGDATGRGVKVAVVDSGVEVDHPAIAGRVAGYVSFTKGEEEPVTSTDPHDDALGHGTACAATVLEHASDCDLYSVRVLGPGASTAQIFLEGLRWVIENGIQVANLSLGTTKREYFGQFYEIADRAYFRNVIFVSAANNFPIPSAPCEYASVISVAAHRGQDPSVFYYNPRPPVEFGAPGVDVRIAWKGGGWMTASGNSFAAPHITGIVARILEKHPRLTPFQVKGVLRALSANVEHAVAAAPGVASR
ncbi:MAG: S8 family serine peptidase [Thermoleophilia bacterium]|nr:S8 family serine peptidase [Thermoleophilia bacterium]